MLKIRTQEELKTFIQDVVKEAAGPDIKDLVSDTMAKALEQANSANKGFESIMHRMDKENQEKERATLRAARMIRAFASAKGNANAAADLLKKWGHEPLGKALAEGTGSSGGYLISPTTGEFIERLSADAVVRKLGARVIPLPNGTMTLPAGSTGATANWVGEGSVAGSSQPSLRSVTLAAKKLKVVIPINNELLNDASNLADEWVESEGKTAAALAEDLAFIRGAGTEHSPRGLRYRAQSANIFNITHDAASATLAEIYADLGKAIQKLADSDVKMLRCGWAMSKRTEWHLRMLLNSLGIPIFQTEMARGMLLGFPYASTTQIPNNLSVVGSADESEVYFADFYSCVIGETMGMEMKVYEGGAYYDSDTSAVVSGISQDQTVVVMSQRVDFASLYQGYDIAVINAVDWGV